MNRRIVPTLTAFVTVSAVTAVASFAFANGGADAFSAPAAIPTCPPNSEDCPIPPPPPPPARWEIRETMGGRCLSVNPADVTGHVIIATCTGSNFNRWTVKSNFTLVSAVNGKCLTVRGGLGDGAQVGLETCTGAENQLWFPQSTKALMGYGGKAIDLEQGGSVQGSEAHMWTYLANPNQAWNVVKVQ